MSKPTITKDERTMKSYQTLLFPPDPALQHDGGSTVIWKPDDSNKLCLQVTGMHLNNTAIQGDVSEWIECNKHK